MNEQLKKELSQERETKFHASMRRHCMSLLDMSRKRMSSLYPKWDKRHASYRGWITPTIEDTKSRERNEPERMIVTLTYSQVRTFVAIAKQMLEQRPMFFELFGVGEEDTKGARIGETLLERDLQKSRFKGYVLYRWLMHFAKYGIGVFKHSWTEKTKTVKSVVTEPPMNIFGIDIGSPIEREIEETITTFMGNEIFNISPYRWFPDTRLPLAEFQQGEFCADERDLLWTQLKQMEKQGEVAGIKHIPKLGLDYFNTRKRKASSVMPDDNITGMSAPQSKGVVVVTGIQLKIVPSEFELEDGKKLGVEDYPMLYEVWLANDARIIKCEPMNYPHDGFTYSAAEFDPEDGDLDNMSLADSLDKIQEAVNWYYNSHILNVKKIINNQLIYDPIGIDADQLGKANKWLIKVKPTASNTDVRRWVHQLDVKDATGRHTEDAGNLIAMAQTATGVSDNLLGQAEGGRRSASEMQNTFRAAFARLKLPIDQAWASCFEPMGQMMLQNHQAFLDVEQLIRIVGSAVDPMIDPQNASALVAFKATKEHIAGTYDFVVFDGSLPSDKQYQANAIQEAALGLISNPNALMLTGWDPRQLLLDAFKLRGINNMRDYNLPPQLADTMRMMVFNNLTGGQLNASTEAGNVPSGRAIENGGQSTGTPNGANGAVNGMAGAPVD